MQIQKTGFRLIYFDFGTQLYPIIYSSPMINRNKVFIPTFILEQSSGKTDSIPENQFGKMDLPVSP